MSEFVIPRVRVTGPRMPGVSVVFSAHVELPTATIGFRVSHGQRVMVSDIQRAVADHYDLTRMELLGERRSRHVARPRQISMWLCRKLTNRSYPDIGRRHGGRDHTTAIHAIRRIDALRLEEPAIRSACDELVNALGGLPE